MMVQEKLYSNFHNSYRSCRSYYDRCQLNYSLKFNGTVETTKCEARKTEVA